MSVLSRIDLPYAEFYFFFKQMLHVHVFMFACSVHIRQITKKVF